jgi:uncharacterized iron-regulated membrane protein
VKGLRWRRGASTLFNLHHTIGFWLCLPLAVLSLTGVYISFPQTSHALFGAPAPPERSGGRSTPPPIEHPTTDVDAAVARALAEKPGASVTTISTPTKGKEPAWRIQLKAPGAKEATTVQVLDATGEIKMARHRGAPGAGDGRPDPLSRWLRRIHDGGQMGVVWQSVIFVAGIAPAVLGVTGLVMWLRRRARRRALHRA